jgi:large conductance mechanosensitive channel
VVNFLIVAFVIFLVLRAYERMRRKEAVQPPPPAELPRDVVLLTEIRDLLRAQNTPGAAPTRTSIQ